MGGPGGWALPGNRTGFWPVARPLAFLGKGSHGVKVQVVTADPVRSGPGPALEPMRRGGLGAGSAPAELKADVVRAQAVRGNPG